MTYNPNDPNRPFEYPSSEGYSGPPANPYQPVDYPANYPSGAPPDYPQFPPPYQGYGANPYDPYGTARPPGTSGMAIASLVTSLAGLTCCGLSSVVGLVLGVMAMREIKRTGQEGYGLALAGTIIGGVLTGIFVIVFILWLIGVAVSGTSSSY
jgi:hypothetical protein